MHTLPSVHRKAAKRNATRKQIQTYEPAFTANQNVSFCPTRIMREAAVTLTGFVRPDVLSAARVNITW